jgi:hypothetical protein
MRRHRSRLHLPTPRTCSRGPRTCSRGPRTCSRGPRTCSTAQVRAGNAQVRAGYTQVRAGNAQFRAGHLTFSGGDLRWLYAWIARSCNRQQTSQWSVGESWDVSPTLMGQHTHTQGCWWSTTMRIRIAYHASVCTGLLHCLVLLQHPIR